MKKSVRIICIILCLAMAIGLFAGVIGVVRGAEYAQAPLTQNVTEID